MKNGRLPATSAHHVSQLAGASSPSSMIVIARSSAASGRGTSSASSSRRRGPSSGAATPPNPRPRRELRGRSHRRSRHAAPDRAEPARRRLQCACHQGDPDARGAFAWLALTQQILLAVMSRVYEKSPRYPRNRRPRSWLGPYGDYILHGRLVLGSGLERYLCSALDQRHTDIVGAIPPFCLVPAKPVDVSRQLPSETRLRAGGETCCV